MLEAIPLILEIRSLLSLIDFDEEHLLLEDLYEEHLLLDELDVDLLLLLLLDELVEQVTDL